VTKVRTPARRAAQLRLSLVLIEIGALLGGVVGCGGGSATSRVVRARAEMGTILEIDAIGLNTSATEQAVDAAFRAVEDVDRRLSNFRSESELSRANATGAGEPFPLSPATWRSLSRALGVARETDGAFDPTVGIVTGAPTIGWERVILDSRRCTVAFGVAGGAIDSGGFGKGEALDRAIVELRRRGVVAARLNFGGQISVVGGGLGNVSIAEPRAGSRRELCAFRVEDASVSTSGVSERPGHIVDPRTGAAAPFTGSVTVVSDNGLRADALSTALFVLGPEAGLELADRHSVAALFAIPRPAGGWDLVASECFPRFTTNPS
jgi:thiamine biosynthesis lipoprotein